MNKITKALKIGVFAAFLAIVATAPTMAAGLADCTGKDGAKYPGLSTKNTGDYTLRCPGTSLYGKSTADCAQAGALASNPDACNTDDLTDTIQKIINTVIFVVGMLAVVMIIIGGVSYATSMGDPGKATKAKNIIMYGIIGLVISLLAFAIVNFVLQAVTGN